MRITIIVSQEAMDAVRSAADNPFGDGGAVRLTDGTWEIPLEGDVFTRLERLKFSEESWSDAIMRIVSNYQTKGRKQ